MISLHFKRKGKDVDGCEESHRQHKMAEREIQEQDGIKK